MKVQDLKVLKNIVGYMAFACIIAARLIFEKDQEKLKYTLPSNTY